MRRQVFRGLFILFWMVALVGTVRASGQRSRADLPVPGGTVSVVYSIVSIPPETAQRLHTTAEDWARQHQRPVRLRWLVTDIALHAGDSTLAPGRYRMRILRTVKGKFQLALTRRGSTDPVLVSLEALPIPESEALHEPQPSLELSADGMTVTLEMSLAHRQMQAFLEVVQ